MSVCGVCTYLCVVYVWFMYMFVCGVCVVYVHVCVWCMCGVPVTKCTYG